MRPTPRVIFASLLAFTLVAGCFGAKDKEPGLFDATATKPRFATSWAYDGAGVTMAEGTANVRTDEATNTGVVNLSVKVGAAAFLVKWTDFSAAADKPFQSGGIAKHLVEHGDSGVGDAAVPKVTAESAAWGEAEVTLDGKPLPDPVTGAATWLAHYMYADEGFRASDGKIYNAAKNAAYDPAKASDASTPGTPQLLVILKSRPPTGPTATQENFTDTVASPQYAKTHTIKVERAGGLLSINLSATSAAPAGPLPADLAFTLKSPDGKTVKTVQIGGTGQAATGRIEVPTAPQGEWKLEVTGAGVQTTYKAATTIALPNSAMLLFEFDEVDTRHVPVAEK